jgi:hypothetical protein
MTALSGVDMFDPIKVYGFLEFEKNLAAYASRLRIRDRAAD